MTLDLNEVTQGMKKQIEEALLHYFNEDKPFIIERILHTGSWNKDFHFKLIIDGEGFTVRFIGEQRSTHDGFGEITDRMLIEQIMRRWF